MCIFTMARHTAINTRFWQITPTSPLMHSARAVAMDWLYYPWQLVFFLLRLTLDNG